MMAQTRRDIPLCENDFLLPKSLFLALEHFAVNTLDSLALVLLPAERGVRISFYLYSLCLMFEPTEYLLSCLSITLAIYTNKLSSDSSSIR
jgi:hypothetical protein